MDEQEEGDVQTAGTSNQNFVANHCAHKSESPHLNCSTDGCCSTCNDHDFTAETGDLIVESVGSDFWALKGNLCCNGNRPIDASELINSLRDQNHLENGCNCILNSMRDKPATDLHHFSIPEDESAVKLNDSDTSSENIKDCSYVSVLSATNDQDCDFELIQCKSVTKSQEMKFLPVDEIDFALGCVDDRQTYGAVDVNVNFASGFCSGRAILCECDLNVDGALDSVNCFGDSCRQLKEINLNEMKTDIVKYCVPPSDTEDTRPLKAANAEELSQSSTEEELSRNEEASLHEDSVVDAAELKERHPIVDTQDSLNESQVCDTDPDIIYDNPTDCNDGESCQPNPDDYLLKNRSCNDFVGENVINEGELDSKKAVSVECKRGGSASNINSNLSDEGVYHSPAENVYEEIRRSSNKNKSNESDSVDQTIFKRGGLVDEIMYEVERVQKGHAQILQELNLDIENLIMPVTPTACISKETSAQRLDLSPDLIPAVNADATATKTQQPNLSTRTLPPLPANSAESTPVLRPTPSCRNLYQTKSAPVSYQIPQTPTQSSSGVKHWFNRLSSLSSFRDKKSKLSSTENARWRLSLRGTDEPVYMLYDDSHRMHEAPKYDSEDGIYEDIDKVNPTYTMSNMGGYTELPVTSSLKDRQSASAAELNEDYSDTESVQSSGSVSVSSFKGKILNLGRKLSRQYDEKGKEIKFKSKLSENDSKSEGKLTRLFSKRKGYDLGRGKERSAVSITLEEEQLPKLRMSMRQKSPVLPPVPTGLAADQMKRRYIIGTVVHSENSYIESLKKLVNDYKKPLEESSPPILSSSKVATLFYRIPEILQCHINFCISLAACIRKWDKEEKMGDVFIQAFSKTSVLDNYSDYINNFSVAVDLAKQEAKRKTAFTDFLKVKQITSQDRLSLFGLMVKPVQRFPQFILLLQDLLKHTPQGHHDRMQLQLALTQMETITDILNERKRESDQSLAVKDILRHVSAKSAARSLAEGTRYLLRQDSLTQLVFNQNGQWKKSKVCRLFLLNDLLVCVTVGPSMDRSDAHKSERYTFKWSVPVREVEIHEEASPILNNMVQAMSAGNQSSSARPDSSNVAEEMEGVKYIYQELGDLLHDFEVMSRIMALVTTLRKSYPEMSKEIIQGLSHSIQQSIQKKDDEVKWIDSCCLQFSVPLKTKTGKIQRELMIFQCKSIDTKQEWLRDVRMSQLALDDNNSPAWNISETSKRSNTKIPLFVNAISVLSSPPMTEVKCGCCHRTMSARLLGRRSQDYVWLCSTDGINSHISIHTLRQMGLRDVFRFDMTECRISTMESVPGIESSSANLSIMGDTVWMGTESRRVLVYSGSDVDHYREVGIAVMAAPVLQIKYHLGQVYVALANGTVACFRRDNTVWQMKDFQVITLSSEPVTCLLPVHNSIFCGCGRKVWIIDSKTCKVVHNHVVHHDHMGSVYSMAHSGIGLWLNLRNTPLVCLYHAETFQHLQDVNISSSIRRILAEQNRPHSPRNYCVTTLTAILGLLWIGTNVGVVLSIPLPRLQGMPILGRRANMAYHANIGPVSLILELNSPSPLVQNLNETPRNPDKGKLVANYVAGSYKSDLATNDDSLSNYGMAKTLPRGWKPSMANADHSECNIYGLYGNLINVREGHDDQIEDDLRRSDPDLIPSLVSTLDRRLRLHSGRPRSLDLANLANLVGVNDLSCVSSSSEDGGSGSQSFTEIPESCLSVCSQIKESNETIEECQIDEQESHTTEDHICTTAVNSNSRKRSFPKSGEPKLQRSVITLIGGRGYTDLRKSATNKEQAIYTSSTSTDAYAILWEMKV